MRTTRTTRTTGLNAVGAMAYAALFTGPMWGMYAVEHRNEALRLSVLASTSVPEGGWHWQEDEPKPLYEVTPDGKTAIIPIVGTLLPDCESWLIRYGYCSCRMALEATRAAERDDSLTTIVYRIKSPGGRVDGVLELAQAIRRLRDGAEKDVLAFIDGMGCSCAYWLASQCQRIYSHETSLISGLGTILTILDWSEYYREMGITVNPIVSDGAETYKSAGLMGTPLTEEQKADLKRMVNETNAVFKAAVRSGRGWSAEQTDARFDGRVHVGGNAQTLRLIDGIASLTDLLAGYLPDDQPWEEEGDSESDDDEAGKKTNGAFSAEIRSAGPARKGNPMSLVDRLLGALRLEGYEVKKAAPTQRSAAPSDPGVRNGNGSGAVAVPALEGNAPAQQNAVLPAAEPSAIEAELARLREAENCRLMARRSEVDALVVRVFHGDAVRLTQARAAVATASGEVLEALAAAYEAATPPDLRPGATRISTGNRMDGATPAGVAPPPAEEFSVLALQQARRVMESGKGE